MAISLDSTLDEAVSPEGRLLRCRELSELAFRRAAECKNDGQRAQLTELGLAWRTLAKETEETLKMLRGLNRLSASA